MESDVKLSLVCGGIVTLSGLLGYIVLPLSAAESSDFAQIAVSVAGRPLEYHAIVLLLPSWLVTFGGVVLARRWGLDSTQNDIVLVGGVVGVPIVVAFVVYVLTAVGMVLAIALGSSVNGPLIVIGIVGLVLLALSIGLAFAAIVFAIVLLVVGSGSVAGYTSARAAIYLWETRATHR